MIKVSKFDQIWSFIYLDSNSHFTIANDQIFLGSISFHFTLNRKTSILFLRLLFIITGVIPKQKEKCILRHWENEKERGICRKKQRNWIILRCEYIPLFITLYQRGYMYTKRQLLSLHSAIISFLSMFFYSYIWNSISVWPVIKNENMKTFIFST